MKTVRTILLIALAVISVANAAQALKRYYHMPLLQHNDMWHRDASFIRTREVLGKLGTSHVGFVAGPGYEDPGGGRRYENQFLLAPIVIKTNPAEEPFVLVGFGANNPTVPMPGLILVEDFQNGFALFRKAQ